MAVRFLGDKNENGERGDERGIDAEWVENDKGERVYQVTSYWGFEGDMADMLLSKLPMPARGPNGEFLTTEVWRSLSGDKPQE